MTKLADRLIAKALLTRRACPSDGRAQTLEPTTRGMDFMPELGALANQNETECFAQLPDDDRRTLERILRQIVKDLGITAIPIE